MIRAILRKTFIPIQIISDYWHRKRSQRLMMCYVLKIEEKPYLRQ
jgi:hypothetical protein